ncbi:MAG: pyruvate kinase, partial [Firmicutes bacterium]|nr:pyruvate kinase [Bacillota bacterium]
MIKTKIVCTLGPATDDPKVLEQLIKAGMNVARLNFSHGTHEEQKRRADMVKDLRKKLKVPVALMIDTKGPDVRVGKFKDNLAELFSGDTFTLTTENVEGTRERAHITFDGLPKKVKIGQKILLDDGQIVMTVTEKTDKDIICLVEIGGILANNKSVNVPGAKLSIPF